MGWGLAVGARAEKPRDWSGEIAGSASRFRADTGITHPILYSLPEWSRSNAADLDLVSRNSAGLSALSDERRRFVPFSSSGFVVGKAYDVTNAVRAPGPEGGKILADLAADGNKVQRVKASAQGYYMMRNFAYSVHYNQQRNIGLVDADQTLLYQNFRDLWVQFSSGGQVFDSGAGRLDLGFAVKGVIRVGAEKAVAVASVPATRFNDGTFNQKGLAIGLDYGLLWTSPGFEGAEWGFQAALVGKDLGTTNFIKADALFKLLGSEVVNARKFPILPNDTSVGLGMKLPNFRDGLRSALRLEWNNWTRPIPAAKKWGVSYELRFPALVSLYSGYRGGAFSGGAGLRFRGIEMDLGTFVDLWGNGSQLAARRAWMMELRSVF